MNQLNIITASTRPGRVGPSVSQWLHALSQDNNTIDAKLVDLADFDLPVFNEAKHPRLGQYQHEATQRWSTQIASADAFVFVLPEYNHLPPPSLLNAITYLSKEWAYKPAGLVSYGGLSGGLRAAQALKPLLAALKMVPMVEAVSIPLVAEHVSDGKLQATSEMDQASMTMLSELSRWASALKVLR